MSLLTVPTELRKKLGSRESEQLVSLLEKVADEQKDHLFELLEERFHRKVESEVHALREEMKNNIYAIREEMKSDMYSLREEMNSGFMEVQKQFSEVQKQFGEVQKQFGEMQKQFGEVQKQITRQSQWMIALIGFLAITLKVLDLIFK